MWPRSTNGDDSGVAAAEEALIIRTGLLLPLDLVCVSLRGVAPSPPRLATPCRWTGRNPALVDAIVTPAARRGDGVLTDAAGRIDDLPRPPLGTRVGRPCAPSWRVLSCGHG
jgi:hypothetical protein